MNAHTLNLAAADPAYRQVLNAGDFVFADGTGIDWAAHLQGIRVLDNMVGTDFVPLLFRETADRGYSYFLLARMPRRLPSPPTTPDGIFPAGGRPVAIRATWPTSG